jgi:hypothetical protein
MYAVETPKFLIIAHALGKFREMTTCVEYTVVFLHAYGTAARRFEI